jgi:hypothetical protein
LIQGVAIKEEGFRGITDIASRVQRVTWSNFNEWDTVIGFFVPMLLALGWDVYNGIMKEMHFHGYTDRRDVRKGLPDCVIYMNNGAYAPFEIKPLSYGTIDRNPKLVARMQGYCTNLGCRLGVLTRLCEMNIYDHLGHEVLTISDASEYARKFEQLWNLLSKEKAASYPSLHSAKERFES